MYVISVNFSSFSEEPRHAEERLQGERATPSRACRAPRGGRAVQRTGRPRPGEEEAAGGAAPGVQRQTNGRELSQSFSVHLSLLLFLTPN